MNKSIFISVSRTHWPFWLACASFGWGAGIILGHMGLGSPPPPWITIVSTLNIILGLIGYLVLRPRISRVSDRSGTPQAGNPAEEYSGERDGDEGAGTP